ncbi:MAG TPA: hypothetical protein VNR89_21620 [Roseomonas sp.]|nr:hypothetical protein [Roseomonas sp.]
MEQAASPPLGRPDGPGTPPPQGGETPRAAASERPDPWGRREGRNNGPGNGPWTEQPGPWSPRGSSRMPPPRGWRRPRSVGASGEAPAWPGRGETLRRIGGFALLGCSLWLVAILAFFQAIIGMFS